MRILFIAPLPPPINGQSIAAELLFDNLLKRVDVDIVNMSKTTHKDGLTSFTRVLEVFRFLMKVKKYKNSADVIYLHISESLFGNLKDLLIYFLCRNKLHKFYIHLHGGSFGNQILKNNTLLARVNAYFLKRINGVIVLGPSHRVYFEKYLHSSKIHSIPNFYLPEFLIEREKILKKFDSPKKVNFLFLSNMIPKKGYLNLLNAFILLDKSLKERIQIDFAGHFNSPMEENVFREKIKDLTNVSYHGVVSGVAKIKLLANANVFVLPTSYSEGQPISILEAYASGCAVIVTMSGGIPDIFKQDINGFALANDTPNEIAKSIKYCIDKTGEVKAMALTNHSISKTFYSADTHVKMLLDLLLKKDR